MDDQNSPLNKPVVPLDPMAPNDPGVDPVESMVEPDTMATDVSGFAPARDAVTSTAVDGTATSIVSTEPMVAATPTLSVATEPATQAAPVATVDAPTHSSPVGSVFGSGPAAPEPKTRKKGMLAMIIAAAAVVVVGGGSAMAYTMYYQNEQKVVTDSIVNMMSAKSGEFTGSMTIKGGGLTPTDVSVNLTGAGNSTAGQVEAKIAVKVDSKSYNVTAGGIVNDKNELYFKVGDVKNIVNEFKVMLPADAHSAIDAIVAKIDNKWIKVDTKSLEDVNEKASKAQTCMTDAVKKFQGDKAAIKQIGSLYRANKFIVIDEKLGAKDGSLGYVLSGDAAAAKAFALSLEGTTLYKDLHACDKSFTIDEKMFDVDTSKTDTSDVRVELWVSRWSHQVTKFSVLGSDKESKTTVSTVFEPVFNTNVTIETPKDATTIEQLQKDVQVLMQDLGVGAAPTPYGGFEDDSFNYRS